MQQLQAQLKEVRSASVGFLVEEKFVKDDSPFLG